MTSFYKSVIRPALFRVDPERIHNTAIRVTAAAGRFSLLRSLASVMASFDHPALKQTIAGIEFKNPLGLAAGFDKNGHAVDLMANLGFGHLEIGSVSAWPSKGNPPPRLFRVPEDRAIVVSYGVPNEGADAVASRLHRRNSGLPLGVNLVKTNDPARPATDEEVLTDYTRAFEKLQGCCDYINLNMSCPNSADDRDFFDELSRIRALLERLAGLNPQVPVFMKLKPVREAGTLKNIVAIADDFSFIAGFGINLPAGKPAELDFASPKDRWAHLPGAVSGKPVERLINDNLKMLYGIIGPDSRYRLVAAGGVFTAEDAYRKIRLGASLVQLYTAMVYEGPGVVKKILRGLVTLLERDGFQEISEAVGADFRVKNKAK